MAYNVTMEPQPEAHICDHHQLMMYHNCSIMSNCKAIANRHNYFSVIKGEFVHLICLKLGYEPEVTVPPDICQEK